MNVLIVDDEPDVRELLKIAVESAGCTRLDVAKSGEEALALALQSHYDLVTLDIRMPRVGGLETLPVIRNAMPRAVIAIISGYSTEAEEEQLADADLVIDKPFEIDTIRDLVTLAGEVVITWGRIRSLGVQPTGDGGGVHTGGG